MEALKRYIIKSFFTLLLFPLRVFKVKKNRVVFANHILLKNGDFSSNPKYLSLYIEKHMPDRFELILAIGKGSEPKEVEELGIKVVRLNSIAYFYYVMTCGFFITTSGGISYVPFRSSQTVINTWHGGGAYKKMSLDIEDSNSLRKAVKMTESKTDYFISSSEKFSEVIRSAFLMPSEKIKNFGLPRNDIFYEERNDIEVKVRNAYKLDAETKIILYAPTYRSADENIFAKHVLGPYDLDYTKLLETLNKRFGGKWVLGIRLHPSISHIELNLPDNVINMSEYPDIQELMYTSEILINDYSSTMWDFSISKKPCFIFAEDLESYTTNLGFYTEPSTWPFPLSQSNDELMTNILNFDSEKYKEDLENYHNWMGNYDMGESCKKTTELMSAILEGA